MPSDATPRRPRPNHRRLLFLFFAGLAGCFLILAYSPSLADSLESLLLVQPSLPLSSLPNRSPDFMGDAPAVRQPAALPADKAALDDDTPVIGVLASDQARAYLVEAFEHGPSSHVVNDVLGGMPISITHCDISGCTRVFVGAASGQPLELAVGGLRSGRMILKFGGHLYYQESAAPLDEGSSSLPYRQYPAECTSWGAWHQAHPRTDVYMGSVDEATPAEARPAAKIPSIQASFSDGSP